jgi:hypothetical protein
MTTPSRRSPAKRGTIRPVLRKYAVALRFRSLLRAVFRSLHKRKEVEYGDPPESRSLGALLAVYRSFLFYLPFAPKLGIFDYRGGLTKPTTFVALGPFRNPDLRAHLSNLCLNLFDSAATRAISDKFHRITVQQPVGSKGTVAGVSNFGWQTHSAGVTLWTPVSPHISAHCWTSDGAEGHPQNNKPK